VSLRHLLQVPQRNIAHPQQARAAGIALFPHRFPNLGVRIGPAPAGRGPVQHIAVHMVGPKMFQRTAHRLRNLNRKAGRGIVGQPMILPRLISELRLQKKIRARHHSRAIRRR
jgi:hypothetical protein